MRGRRRRRETGEVGTSLLCAPPGSNFRRGERKGWGEGWEEKVRKEGGNERETKKKKKREGEGERERERERERGC
jgi:hypothetical protein